MSENPSNLVVKANQMPVVSNPAQAIAQPAGGPAVTTTPVQPMTAPPASVSPGPVPGSNQADLDKAALDFEDEQYRQEHSLSKMTTRFLQDTTMHGIPQAVDSDWALGHNFLARKFVWFMLWFGAMAALVSYSITEVKTFYTYPYNTKISIETEQTLEFPAVSVCPLNVISKEKASNYSAYNQITYSVMGSFGHEMSDFLIKCSFNGKVCSTLTKFQTFVDKFYGNCFTFNTSELTLRDRTVNEPNKDNGLTLRLLINSALYQTYSEELGFVVKVHEADIDAEMSDGVKIPSGYSSEVRLRRLTIDRLSYPYNQEKPCLASSEVTTGYNRAKCNYKCINENSMALCGCGVGITETITKQCTTDAELECYNAVLFPGDGIVLGLDGIPCSVTCLNPCTETKYDMQLSLSDYPSKYDTRVLTKANLVCMAEIKSLVIGSFPEHCSDAVSTRVPPPSPSGRRLASIQEHAEYSKQKRLAAQALKANMITTNRALLHFQRGLLGDTPPPGAPAQTQNSSSPTFAPSRRVNEGHAPSNYPTAHEYEPPSENKTDSPTENPNAGPDPDGGGATDSPGPEAGTESPGAETVTTSPGVGPDEYEYETDPADADGESEVDYSECSDGCYNYWLGDDYCDPECNNGACGFDDGDCGTSQEDLEGLGIDVGDGAEVGGAIQQELAALFGNTWSPNEQCRSIGLTNVFEKYGHVQKEGLAESVIEEINLSQVLQAMINNNVTSIGEWITYSCGQAPNSTASVNWDFQPLDQYIVTAWSAERSSYSLIRVYFSEFNIQRIVQEQSLTVFGVMSGLGGMFGLGAGVSVMTMIEFLEFGAAVLFFLFCGCCLMPSEKSKYKVTPFKK